MAGPSGYVCIFIFICLVGSFYVGTTSLKSVQENSSNKWDHSSNMVDHFSNKVEYTINITYTLFYIGLPLFICQVEVCK